MKPGLYLPSQHPKDAIDCKKIEDAQRVLFREINGGLSGQNLAPSVRLPNSRFRENCSLIMLSGSVGFTSGEFSGGFAVNGYIPLGFLSAVSPSVSGRIVLVSWALSTEVPALVETTRTVRIKTGSTVRLAIDAGTKRIKTTIQSSPLNGPLTHEWIVGSYAPDYRTNITSGAFLSAEIFASNTGGGSPGVLTGSGDLRVAIVLAVPHVA